MPVCVCLHTQALEHFPGERPWLSSVYQKGLFGVYQLVGKSVMQNLKKKGGWEEEEEGKRYIS